MINITAVLIILFCHWVFDFVIQTDEQAKNKSTNTGYLLQHTFMYSICWIIPFYLAIGHLACLYFVLITFVAHTITDYFTSRLNKKLWDQGSVHYFFVSIGFDQFLHFAQLLLTYYFLVK